MSMSKWHFLTSLLNPRSVAVVGASRNPSTVNFHLFANMVKLGFSGKIYPVNPSADEILGVRAYPSLKSIEDDIDLVVCAVPAHMALNVIDECVEKKVKWVALVTGGFSEIGEEGGKIQDEIANSLKKSGIRAIGPNALSPINSLNNLAVSFTPIKKLTRGHVSFIFQSGMYEGRLNWILSDFHLGISKIIDLGNKMDINEVDALEYLAEDPDTEVIAIHLETVKGDGRRFVQLLKDTSREKPVVVLKSGRTLDGAKAVASHSGSIARESDIVFDAILKQAGVIRARGLEDFFDYVKAFAFSTPPDGDKIVVASLSGGEGVVATDICLQDGFSMAAPCRRTYDKIKAVFPPWQIPLNPFDLGVCVQFHRTNRVYDLLLDSMLDDDNVHCMAIQLPASVFVFGAEDFCRSFMMAKEKGKPVVVWRPVTGKADAALVEKLELGGVPVYPSAARAIKALSVPYRYKMMQQETA